MSFINPNLKHYVSDDASPSSHPSSRADGPEPASQTLPEPVSLDFDEDPPLSLRNSLDLDDDGSDEDFVLTQVSFPCTFAPTLSLQ